MRQPNDGIYYFFIPIYCFISFASSSVLEELSEFKPLLPGTRISKLNQSPQYNLDNVTIKPFATPSVPSNHRMDNDSSAARPNQTNHDLAITYDPETFFNILNKIRDETRKTQEYSFNHQTQSGLPTPKATNDTDQQLNNSSLSVTTYANSPDLSIKTSNWPKSSSFSGIQLNSDGKKLDYPANPRESIQFDDENDIIGATASAQVDFQAGNESIARHGGLEQAKIPVSLGQDMPSIGQLTSSASRALNESLALQNKLIDLLNRKRQSDDKSSANNSSNWPITRFALGSDLAGLKPNNSLIHQLQSSNGTIGGYKQHISGSSKVLNSFASQVMPSQWSKMHLPAQGSLISSAIPSTARENPREEISSLTTGQQLSRTRDIAPREAYSLDSKIMKQFKPTKTTNHLSELAKFYYNQKSINPANEDVDSLDALRSKLNSKHQDRTQIIDYMSIPSSIHSSDLSLNDVKHNELHHLGTTNEDLDTIANDLEDNSDNNNNNGDFESYFKRLNAAEHLPLDWNGGDRLQAQLALGPEQLPSSHREVDQITGDLANKLSKYHEHDRHSSAARPPHNKYNLYRRPLISKTRRPLVAYGVGDSGEYQSFESSLGPHYTKTSLGSKTRELDSESATVSEGESHVRTRSAPYGLPSETMSMSHLSASPSHQVVHIHHAKEKKSHGKYLWPIVGGGLTMLMGFLILSNMMLSIPLLAIGASQLLNPGGNYQQQLVPVYNLSRLVPAAAGKKRRRRRRWTSDGSSSKKVIELSILKLGHSRESLGKPNDETGLVKTANVAVDKTEIRPSPGQYNPNTAASLSQTIEKTYRDRSNHGNVETTERHNKLSDDQSEQLARVERFIDKLVVGAATSKLLGGWSIWGNGRRRQMLLSAYCRRPQRIMQQALVNNSLRYR